MNADPRTHILPARGPIRTPDAVSGATLPLPDSPLVLDLDWMHESLPGDSETGHLRLNGNQVEVFADEFWSAPKGVDPDPAIKVYLELWQREINLALSAPLILHRLVASANPKPRVPERPPRAPRPPARGPRHRAAQRAWRREHSNWLAAMRSGSATPPHLETEHDWFDRLCHALRGLPLPDKVGLSAQTGGSGETVSIGFWGVRAEWATGSAFRANLAAARLDATRHPEFSLHQYERAMVASLLLSGARAAFRSAIWRGVHVSVRGPSDLGRPLLGTLGLNVTDRELTLLELCDSWPNRPCDGDAKLILAE